MKDYQSPGHTRWDCKYHVVFIPKRRKKKKFGLLRWHLGEMFHDYVARCIILLMLVLTSADKAQARFQNIGEATLNGAKLLLHNIATVGVRDESPLDLGDFGQPEET